MTRFKTLSAVLVFAAALAALPAAGARAQGGVVLAQTPYTPDGERVLSGP